MLAIAALASACGSLRPAPAPIPALRDAAPCAVRPTTLIVMLPGAYSSPEELVREGFVTAVRSRGIAADITIPDAHLGYYRGGAIDTRLHDDVIGPARAAGYRDVWLVGISLGGFGALLYADGHPEDVRGVVALAPYLGRPALGEAVRGAGGLRAWTAPVGPLPVTEDGAEQQLWRHLQQTVARPVVPLYLGYGLDDRFAPVNGLLADAMPAAQVFTMPGGHDWPVWTPLLGRILDTMPLPRDAGCRRG